MSIYDVFSGGSKPFDKEQWAAQKQAQRKEAYELIDNTCSEMMISGDSFRQYLDVQGRFDRYSVNNAILVSAQMPEATQLKEKAAWKQSRVYVNKDAKKVVILEPSKEYTRDDGSKAVGYNAKEVYDISETSKVISVDRQKMAQIQAFNLRGTLNKRSNEKQPEIVVPISSLPTRIVSLDFKPGSTNTVELYMDGGWQFSFRIHNASTLVETSLKFDVQIIGMPATIITINCTWR